MISESELKIVFVMEMFCKPPFRNQVIQLLPCNLRAKEA